MNRKFIPTRSEPYPSPARLVLATATALSNQAIPLVKNALEKIQITPPINDKFSLYEQRLETFYLTPWPHINSTRFSPEALSEAGFVNLGYRDIVQCFHCNGCVGNWIIHDLDPVIAHASWHPQCPFIKTKLQGDEICRFWKANLKKHGSSQNPPTLSPWGFESPLCTANFVDPYIDFEEV